MGGRRWRGACLPLPREQQSGALGSAWVWLLRLELSLLFFTRYPLVHLSLAGQVVDAGPRAFNATGVTTSDYTDAVVATVLEPVVLEGAVLVPVAAYGADLGGGGSLAETGRCIRSVACCVCCCFFCDFIGMFGGWWI